MGLTRNMYRLQDLKLVSSMLHRQAKPTNMLETSPERMLPRATFGYLYYFLTHTNHIFPQSSFLVFLFKLLSPSLYPSLSMDESLAPMWNNLPLSENELATVDI